MLLSTADDMTLADGFRSQIDIEIKMALISQSLMFRRIVVLIISPLSRAGRDNPQLEPPKRKCNVRTTTRLG